MKSIKPALVAVTILVSGCVTPPQTAVYLDQNSLASQSGRLGIAMTTLPKVDIHLPGTGVGCLLCMAAASISNSTLTAHVRTLPYEDLPNIKEYIAASLRKKGADVTVIEEDLDMEKLSEASAKGPDIARKNFSPLRQKYNIDRLLVIDIDTLGVSRTYSAYFSIGDPQVVLQGTGYIVNLKDNTYEWYLPVNIFRSSDGDWNEPPHFPRLTNAYLQALETGKGSFTRPFAK